MIDEVEEIMDESETYVKRKKVSEKLKKYVIETIIPVFEMHYDKCKDKDRGIYYMFCNTTKQPGVFSFAICNVGSQYGNIKNLTYVENGQQIFLLLNDDNLGELNDSPELRKEFTDFLNEYFAQNTLFCTGPTSRSGKIANQTEADDSPYGPYISEADDDPYGPYISGYIRKRI